jgi:hypothetical protein
VMIRRSLELDGHRCVLFRSSFLADARGRKTSVRRSTQTHRT